MHAPRREIEESLHDGPRSPKPNANSTVVFSTRQLMRAPPQGNRGVFARPPRRGGRASVWRAQQAVRGGPLRLGQAGVSVPCLFVHVHAPAAPCSLLPFCQLLCPLRAWRRRLAPRQLCCPACRRAPCLTCRSLRLPPCAPSRAGHEKVGRAELRAWCKGRIARYKASAPACLPARLAPWPTHRLCSRGSAERVHSSTPVAAARGPAGAEPTLPCLPPACRCLATGSLWMPSP